MQKFVILWSQLKITEVVAMQNSKTDCFLRGEELYRSIVGENPIDVHIVVERLLMSLGFKSKLEGTLLLRDVILYRYDNANIVRMSYTSEVYPAVAKEDDLSPANVERTIRGAITECAHNGNLFAFVDLLHGRLTDKECVPSAVEFISCVVYWLRLQKELGKIL